MPGRIRRATEDDAKAIADIYKPYVLHSAISFEIDPPSPDEIRLRVQAVTKRFPWLVCEDSSGSLRGYAYACIHRERLAYRWSTDCAIYVDARRHRRGIGRGLYTSLFELLRQQGYFNVYAGITLPNEASIGLHTRMGFQPVGTYKNAGFKLGRWHDVAWLVLALQPPVAQPSEPCLPEQLTAEIWLDALTSGESLLK